MSPGLCLMYIIHFIWCIENVWFSQWYLHRALIWHPETDQMFQKLSSQHPTAGTSISCVQSGIKVQSSDGQNYAVSVYFWISKFKCLGLYFSKSLAHSYTHMYLT